MMLRLFFWLLLLTNGLLFAIGRGYFGVIAIEQHEPQRLTQQLHPENLTILAPDDED